MLTIRADGSVRNDRSFVVMPIPSSCSSRTEWFNSSSTGLDGALKCRPSEVTDPLFPGDRS
ncbi:hypothetical protein CGZ80_11095 [Rhodopirellula sp. MGV]|nr:hypothetical protein CGZ80_11095 [Rhodopirellula sp. MGV]